MMLGRYPPNRHDGVDWAVSPYMEDTKQRAKRVKDVWQWRTVGVGFRGDWAWLKQATDVADWGGDGAEMRM